MPNAIGLVPLLVLKKLRDRALKNEIKILAQFAIFALLKPGYPLSGSILKCKNKNQIGFEQKGDF